MGDAYGGLRDIGSAIDALCDLRRVPRFRGQARQLYIDALGDVPAGYIPAAVKHLVRSCKWMPTPAEFLEAVRETMPPVSEQQKVWMARLKGYRPGGLWLSDWGPRPEERGCQVPPMLLVVWRAQEALPGR